jgi:IS5 family transposase
MSIQATEYHEKTQTREATMRQKRTVQYSLFDSVVEHEIAIELEGMSRVLDAHPIVLDWVEADLRGALARTGRQGLSVESILRCAILKQSRQLTYQELAFFLQDSISLRAFARLAMGCPQKSALQVGIAAISAGTWQQLNRLLLQTARLHKVETGRVVRIDSTVTDTPIAKPSDSALLHDVVRVSVRLLKQFDSLRPDPAIPWHDHRRVAKRLAYQLQYTPKRQRPPTYRKLIKIASRSLGYVSLAQVCAGSGSEHNARVSAWIEETDELERLGKAVIDQTRRRVFNGETVPSNDKVVSLFEPHTEIIVKGRRDVAFGHKLNLTTGRSGLVLDLAIESGNPADTDRFLPMLARQTAMYGRPPRQVATDGGYASRSNLAAAKALGVKDVAFHKKKGLEVREMVKSPWVYRKLRNFRAGIEGNISCLKRAYGLSRCTWKGLEHFRSYLWSAVVARNLLLLAKRLQT